MKTLALAALLVAFPFVLVAAPPSDAPLPTDDPQAAALYQACQKEDLAEVKNLVGSGAPIDGQVGTLKSTPLMAANDRSNLEILKFLIDYRAKLDLPDAEGSTTLLHACFVDHADIALALIAAGANVNQGSSYGRTPLMYAADKGDDRIVQALIDHKVDLKADCNQGPALHWAASSNHLSTVKLLVAAGANPNQMPPNADKYLYSILGCAAENENLEMIDYLLGQKADVNGAGADGITPLMSAIDYGRTEAVKKLLDAGANLEARNAQGMTALMVAGREGKIHSVRALLDRKADVNAADPQGETALTMAGERGEVDIVGLLKSSGAKRTDVHIIPRPQLLDALPPAPGWVISVSAVYALRNGNDPKILGGGDTPVDCRRMLKRDWNVGDKADLLKELDDLRDSGHHAFYQAEGARLSQLTEDQFNQYLGQHSDKTVQLKAMRASYAKWKERSGLAWDLVRAANITNAGFAARYLTVQEAWQRLFDIGRTLQGSFSSWQEMSDNFLDGREIWASQRDPRFEAVAALLLNPNDPNSPWTQNPWKTDLTGDWVK